MGQPSDLPPEEPKPRRKRSGSEKRKAMAPFPLRLLPEQRAAIEAAAERAGMTTASYIRSCLPEASMTQPVYRPRVEDIALVKVQRELNRIGGNIHQLLKHVNFGRIIDTDGEISAAFAGFREGINLLREMRGRPTL